MPKVGKEDAVLKNPDFTTQQLDAFEKKMGEYPSEEELLKGLGAISYPGGVRHVTWFDNLRGTIEPITGCIFPGEIPYQLYQRLIDAIQKRTKKREHAKKMQAEYMEKSLLGNL